MAGEEVWQDSSLSVGDSMQGKKMDKLSLDTNNHCERRNDHCRQPTTINDHPPPFFWARWIARRPKLCFGVSLSVQVGFVVVSILLAYVGYDILPAVFEDLPIDSDSEPMYLRQQAWKHRFDDLTKRDPSRSSGREARSIPDSVLATSADDIKVVIEPDPNASPYNNHHNRYPFMVDELNAAAMYEELARGNDEEMKEAMNCFPMDGPQGPHCHKHDERSGASGAGRTGASLRSKRDITDDGFIHSRELHLGSLTLMYEVPEGENIFTEENLRKIAKLEYDLYMRDDFQFHFCKLSLIAGALNCEQFISVLRLFDGSFSSFNDKLFDPSFTNISLVLAQALESETTEDLARSFFSKDAAIDTKTMAFSSRQTRSTINFGYPLIEFGNQTDNRLEQRKVLRRWLREDIVPVLADNIKQGVGNTSFSYFSPALYFDEALVAIKVEWTFIFGAILFNFVFMWFQTGSLWITSFGIFGIITSFVGANLVYRVVFGYRYFGYFNILALFILLGIGADDIFIFTDTWKIHHLKQMNSRQGASSNSLEHRISSVFKRAVVAMFVTSLTTMTAFFVSSVSPLLPIAGFGTFSGLAVFINYMTVMTFLPCVVVVHHIYLENRTCGCCSGGHHNQQHYQHEKQLHENGTLVKESYKVTKPSLHLRLNRSIIRFFRVEFFRFVTHRIVRVVILVLFVMMLGSGIYLCTTIQLDSETFRLFTRSHTAEIAKHKLRYDFMSNSQEAKVTVSVVWGLGPQDRSMCPSKEYNGLYPCEGLTVWDEGFNLNQPEAQLALYNFCTLLKASNESGLMLSRDGHQNNVTCFLHDMVHYFKEESEKPQYPPGTDFSLPLTTEKMQTLVQANSILFKNDSHLYIDHPFELALEWWLTDGYSNETVKDKRGQYAGHLGLEKVDDRNLAWSNGNRLITYMDHWRYPEIFNKRMLFASIEAVTTVSEWSIGLSDGLQLINSWESFIHNQSAKWPSQLQRGWQFSETFVWLRVIEKLASQAVSAVAVGLLLSFVVICLGTTNLLTALWASVLLGAVPVCALAMVPLLGWKFGLPEALNLCLIVGIAVDYIVHMAEGYHMSPRHTRLQRLEDALESVGISILAGAITTLGASFFMMLPRLLFFKQFGAFVFMTILLSTVFSLFVFPAGFSFFGPEGQWGSFMTLCRSKQTNARRRRSEEEECSCTDRKEEGRIEEEEKDPFMPTSNNYQRVTAI